MLPASAAPTPTPQYMRALEVANDVRLARAAIRRKVSAPRTAEAGDLLLAPYIEAPPPCMEKAVLFDVLQWPRRRGPRHALRTLDTLRMLDVPVVVSQTTTLGRLTERQRRAIARVLRAGQRPSPGRGSRPIGLAL